MATGEEKKTSSSNSTSSKTTKVEIAVSAYYFKDKPISVIGIYNEDTVLRHIIQKKDLTKDGWFSVLKDLERVSIASGEKDVIRRNILDDEVDEVALPVSHAKRQISLGDLQHKVQIIKTEI